MKKVTFSMYFVLAIICSFVLMSNMNIEKTSYESITTDTSLDFLRSTGSPGDYTGSPGDGYYYCTECHNSNPGNFSLIPTISTDIPITGYVLGETYTINVSTSSSGASGWGFELTAEKVGGIEVGTYDLTGSINSPKIITSGGSVTHSNDAFSSWSFSWTAPSIDEGDITFYAAVLAANGSGTGGDQVVTTSEVVSASTLGIDEKNSLTFDIYPNPSRDYLIVKLPNEISEGLVEIFDFSGRSVTTSKINKHENRLSLTNFAVGMYIIRLTSEGKTGVKKFIKAY